YLVERGDRMISRVYTAFFFQAEDGIRDGHVTGVQTCALPISRNGGMIRLIKEANKVRFRINVDAVNRGGLKISSKLLQLAELVRSEERRVGKECRSRWWPDQ